MVHIGVGSETYRLWILGHGLVIPERFEISDGVFVSPDTPSLDANTIADACVGFDDYASVISGSGIASFSLAVEGEAGSQDLLQKGWNSLWLFHLLSLACRSPCFSLYSISEGGKPRITRVNRNPFVPPLAEIHSATPAQLQWAKQYKAAFDSLVLVPEFGTAMRCYGNAHYLPDVDVRIMLLWSGIEGLLSVDGELNRRIALYTALMLDGTPSEKAAYFDEVKRAYGIRSRAVHGGGAAKEKLELGYRQASKILSGLLARCVELGRVPTPSELDRLAVTPTLR